MARLANIRGLVRQWRFTSSGRYWDRRYKAGGSSGDGSYGEEARFKARVVNANVSRLGCRNAVELGCGDGNQAGLFDIPEYYGVDVSRTAVESCKAVYSGDPTKCFMELDEFVSARGDRIPRRYDCALSLDVAYHLVEDATYEEYLTLLFDCAPAVIIYSSNEAAEVDPMAPHVRHRHILGDISRLFPDWVLADHISNPHHRGEVPRRQGGPVDFFVFQRSAPACGH